MNRISISKIVYTIMSLLLLMFVGYLSLANILPFKYIMIVSLVMLLFDLALYFTLAFRMKKGKNKKRRTAGYIISVFLLAIIVIATYYISNTMSFFRSFGDNKYQEENYLILVRKESSYKSFEDLENIGYVKQELGNQNKAIEKIQEKKTIQMFEYEQYNLLMKSLMDSKIQSLLIEESYYELLNESLNYSSYFEVIDKISIVTEIDYSSKEVDVTRTTFSVYISGIDTYGNISGVSRSDVNILATINPTTKQILFISIPRDYYVQLRGTTGYKDKLTHAGVYGVDMSIGTIEDLLDVEINYYFRVNFSTLEKVIDTIGGVDVYSKYNFTSSQASGGVYKFYKGYNHLNGKQALSFSRERKALPGGDRGRGENQQAVLDGVVRKATSATIITKYTSILKNVEGSFQTNMDENDIQKLIKMQLNDMASWNVTSYSLNGYDGSEYTYSHPFQKLYVMHPYEKTVENGKNLIDKVYAGELLESSYEKVTDIKEPVPVQIKEPIPEPVSEPIISEPINNLDLETKENPEDIENSEEPISEPVETPDTDEDLESKPEDDPNIDDELIEQNE